MVELAAGRVKHILCEKPIATTVEDAQAIIDICVALLVETFSPSHVIDPSCVSQTRLRLFRGRSQTNDLESSGLELP